MAASVAWVKAKLRGQSVYARATDAGELLVEAGRVEIRYKANDGRKYTAMPKNLEREPGPVLPDETCGPAEAVDKDAAKAKSKEKSAADAEKAVKADPNAIVAYTDGACSGNPGPAGLGVIVMDGTTRIELSEYLGTGTNNVAELTAILR